MKVDHMSSSGFYMEIVWEFDIFFFEFDIELLSDPRTDSMFIESSEYFFSFSFQSKFENLSFESFLYFKCLFETESCLILCSFFVEFYFFKSIRGNFSNYFLWDEWVACLRCWHLDDCSFATYMSNILEEFDGDFVCWHREGN